MKSKKPDAKKPQDKNKKAGKALVPAKGAAKSAPKITADTPDERRAARNVAQIRNKLATAMEDPHMREQIARAMRQMINEGKE